MTSAPSLPTLAQKLGVAPHVSPLLCKAQRLGLRSLVDLQNLAVQRGCRHYWHEGVPEGELVGKEQFSNEELAIALLSVANPYDPHSIRCGAAMLSDEDNDVAVLTHLARQERCVAVVGYVAKAGRKFEPEHPFWSELLAQLPQFAPPKEGVLPHPTRFVAMNGYVRHIGPCLQVEWQRPQPPVTA